MKPSHTQRLADYLAGLRYEEIPAHAIEQAKKLTLHTAGAAIASLGHENAGKPIRIAMENGGPPEATLWGSPGGAKVSAQEAAFSNGTLSDLLDWEDCSWTGHGSAGVIPVAMALGEKYHISGRDYLTAVVTGFEGYHRAAMAVQPTQEYLRSGNGWGLVSWQVFAGAIPAGKILGLDPHQFNQLFGACQYLTIVPTNRHSEGNRKSDVYHFCHGFCARNGIAAAMVTREGFSNLTDCFEGSSSAYWQFLSDRLDESWLVRGLGDEWYINATYLKHWPANMWIQTSLEALDRIMKQRPFTPEEVDVIRVSPTLGMICGNYAESSRTCLDAQFSIGYCLTAYLMDETHTPGSHWFSQERLNDPALIAFADSKYEFFGPSVSTLDCFEEFRNNSFPAAEVEIRLQNGEVLREAVRYPKGHPQNNFTMEEERAHFRTCCTPYLRQTQIDAILRLVDRLETLEDIAPLAEQFGISRR